MSPLFEKRFNIILKTMKTYGIEHGENIFMSINSLCSDINNTWNAKYFVNTKKFKSDYNQFALQSWETHELRRAVISTAKKSGLEFREGNNYTDYIKINREVL